MNRRRGPNPALENWIWTANCQRSEIHDGSEEVDRRSYWSIGFDRDTNPMFLDGRLGIAFDSNAVSLRVLKIGHGIVGGFHEEESVASVRRFRIVDRQMEAPV